MFYCFCVLVGCLKSGRIYVHAEIEKINHEISKKKKKKEKEKTQNLYMRLCLFMYILLFNVNVDLSID